MKKICFARDFSLNGTWFKKGEQATLVTSISDALISEGVAREVTVNKTKNKKDNK